MRITVEKSVFTKFPRLQLLVFVVKDIRNKEHLPEVQHLVAEAARLTQLTHHKHTLKSHHLIAPWVLHQRAFGAKGQMYHTSVEVLVRKVLHKKSVVARNTLTNILMLMIQGLTQPAVVEKIRQEGKTINLSPIIAQILLRSKIKDPDIFRNIKPEESMGYSSNQQLSQARENVNAALTNQQIPFPPQEGDDHIAKLTIYTEIQQLMQKMGQVSDVLEQLIQMQGALLQQVQEQQAQEGQKVNLKKPQTVTF
jgi:hypothetical protein